MSKPIHIVMTPTRNEAWVIRAFLQCNGLWADYIIIADQMSTDGTRDIIAEYMSRESVIGLESETTKNHRCEIILIDNTNPEFNEPERQAMLVAKAREVAAGRDTLLWGLDADEILPANWLETEDGQKILKSVQGDVFHFKWAQLAPDKKHYGDAPFYPWLFHDDSIEPHGNYVRNMHSMRIPYPIEEKQLHYVNDFRVLHFGLFDPLRIAAKNRFYQFVDWERNHKTPIALARTYAAHRLENQINDFSFVLDTEWMNFPFDVWSMVKVGTKHTWFDDYIYERLGKYPMYKLRKLDLWDEEFLEFYNIVDKRRWIDKLVHTYFHKTERNKRHILIRTIDKMLKIMY